MIYLINSWGCTNLLHFRIVGYIGIYLCNRPRCLLTVSSIPSCISFRRQQFPGKMFLPLFFCLPRVDIFSTSSCLEAKSSDSFTHHYKFKMLHLNKRTPIKTGDSICRFSSNRLPNSFFKVIVTSYTIGEVNTFISIIFCMYSHKFTFCFSVISKW